MVSPLKTMSTKTPPTYLYTTGDLAVRELTIADEPTMSRWLTDPRILDYWGGRDHPLDIAGVHQEFFLEPDNNAIQCIVDYRGEPLGYIQFYAAEDEIKLNNWHVPVEQHVWGIDLFIGEPDYWGKGLGTELLIATVAYIRRTYHPDKVVIDPKADNARAIRSYEKAGFRIAKLLPHYEFHEGHYTDNWLMVHEG